MAETSGAGSPVERAEPGLPDRSEDAPAAARQRRNVLWGILCTVAGLAIFAFPFLYGVMILVWGGYALSLSQSSGGYNWAGLFMLVGVGIAMVGMVVAPIAFGMAVVNRQRSNWVTGIIFAVPAVILTAILCIMMLRDIFG